MPSIIQGFWTPRIRKRMQAFRYFGILYQLNCCIAY